MRRIQSEAYRAWKRRQYRKTRKAMDLLDRIAERAAKDPWFETRVRERLLALAQVALEDE